MKTFFTSIFFTLISCLSAFSNPVAHHPHFFSPLATETFRSNLSIVGTDGTPTLVDGDLTQYDPSYSDAVDGMDARKISNFSENIGMLRSATVLVIERRHTIETADSIFFKMWNLKQITYQLEFITSNLNHPGLSGYLEDDYLHQNTPLDLNGTNDINFTVTSDPASANMYRFRIIFSTEAARLLPLTFTSIKASEQNNVVNIDWKTTNENNIRQYTVQRSADGSHYMNLDNLAAYNLAQNNYSVTDNNPLSGNSYYRIQSTATTGETSSSDVLKIYMFKGSAAFAIYPNPAINHIINLQMINQPQGNYFLRIINNIGQPVSATTIQHNAGSSNETLNVPGNLSKGIYQLEITAPDGNKNIFKIVL